MKTTANKRIIAIKLVSEKSAGTRMIQAALNTAVKTNAPLGEANGQFASFFRWQAKRPIAVHPSVWKALWKYARQHIENGIGNASLRLAVTLALMFVFVQFRFNSRLSALAGAAMGVAAIVVAYSAV